MAARRGAWNAFSRGNTWARCSCWTAPTSGPRETDRARSLRSCCDTPADPRRSGRRAGVGSHLDRAQQPFEDRAGDLDRSTLDGQHQEVAAVVEEGDPLLVHVADAIPDSQLVPLTAAVQRPVHLRDLV